MQNAWTLPDELGELENALNNAYNYAGAMRGEKMRDIKVRSILNEYIEEAIRTDQFKVALTKLAAIIKYEEMITEARKKESQRLAKLAGFSKNIGTELRKYLLETMKTHNLESVQGVNNRVYLGNGSPTVDIKIPDEHVPNEYCRIKKDPDKTKIKEMLKKYGNQEWCELVTNKIVKIS